MRVEDLLDRLRGVKPTGSDRWQALCPAHDDHKPSLSVGLNCKSILLKCHAGCETADVLSAMDLDLSDLFLDAHKKTPPGPCPMKPLDPKRVLPPRPFDPSLVSLWERALESDREALAYLEGRGLTLDTIHRFRLGLMKDHEGVRRIAIPWFLDGVAVGAKKRALPPKDDDGVKKWTRSKGSPSILFNGDSLKGSAVAYVAEAELDALALEQAGFAPAVASTLGVYPCKARPAPAWDEWLAMLQPTERVYICFDGDVAGRDGAAELAAKIGPAARVVHLPDGEDCNSFLMDHAREDMARLIEAATPAPASPTTTATQTTDTTTAGTVPVPTPRPLTDSGNGELFADLYDGKARFDHKARRWFIWRGLWWGADETGEALELAKDAARLRFKGVVDIDDLKSRDAAARWAIQSESKPRLDAALSLAATDRRLADTGDTWDADHDLLGVANGVLDLRTGALIEPDPAQKITKHIQLNYPGPNAWPERWIRFLDEVFGGDSDLVDFIQKAVGYSLTGHTREQVYFLCHGKGANGKSTFLKVLQTITGPYGVNCPFSAFELQGRASIPTDLAMMKGARLVTSSETGATARLNESRIKALSGQDEITARHLYEKETTWTATCKIWLAVNHRPIVRDDSHGFWRRVRLVPFTQIFDPATEPGLEQTLMGGAPAILSWAVRGAMAWRQDGLRPVPEAVTISTREYEQDQDPIGAWITQAVDVDPDGSAAAADLWRSYDAWAEGAGLRNRERMTSTAFGRLLAGRWDKKKTMKGARYFGLRIKGEPSQAGLELVK